MGEHRVYVTFDKHNQEEMALYQFLKGMGHKRSDFLKTLVEEVMKQYDVSVKSKDVPMLLKLVRRNGITLPVSPNTLPKEENKITGAQSEKPTTHHAAGKGTDTTRKNPKNQVIHEAPKTPKDTDSAGERLITTTIQDDHPSPHPGADTEKATTPILSAGASDVTGLEPDSPKSHEINALEEYGITDPDEAAAILGAISNWENLQ